MLRGSIGSICRAQEYTDFLVISPTGINVGAMNGEYIGKKLLPHDSEFIARALSGKTIISRPFRTELPLPDETGLLQQGLATMFAATPIRGSDGSVVGILALLIKPEKAFTHILSVGRPGGSGETYAFDAKGRLISPSRFDDHLKRIGLLDNKPNVRAYLNIEIRDPGGNLLKGFRPSSSRSEQPLTHMAKSATSGEDGLNVDGYRDYRGVPVIGAWTWLGEYGFGVTTELDVSEAFRSVKVLRTVFAILFGLLILASLIVLFSTTIISRLRHRMERLGQYTLERKLGKGGMGTVYLARHTMLRRPTALKILRPVDSSEETISRFEKEVQITSQLLHLNTIRIYDYGRTRDGTFYYAMQYLPGINLGRLVAKTGPLPEGRIIYILLQVCGSLYEAHTVGLIHRDIKPENVIIYHISGTYDIVKVCDFGLVKSLSGPLTDGDKSGNIIAGTPQYLAPEAIEDPQNIDARADIYALGALAFFLLTGRDVFEGKTAEEICRKQIKEMPERPSKRLDRSVSKDFEDLVLLCLEKDPDRRPNDIPALVKKLRACKDAEDWTEEKRKTWWDEIGDRVVHEERMSGEVPETTESQMAVDLGQRVSI
jgi:hypothetical protein